MIAEKIVCWRAVLIASLRSREETSPWQSSTNWYRKPSAASEGSTVVFYVFSFCSIIVVCLFFWGGKKNYNLNHLRPSQPWWNSGWRNLLLVIKICQIPRLLLHPSDTHHSSFPLFLDKLIIYILCATQKSAIRTQPRQQAVSRCGLVLGRNCLLSGNAITITLQFHLFTVVHNITKLFRAIQVSGPTRYNTKDKSNILQD